MARGQVKIEMEELIELHGRGFNDHEIACRLQCTAAGVRYHRLKLDLRANASQGGKRYGERPKWGGLGHIFLRKLDRIRHL